MEPTSRQAPHSPFHALLLRPHHGTTVGPPCSCLPGSHTLPLSITPRARFEPGSQMPDSRFSPLCYKAYGTALKPFTVQMFPKSSNFSVGYINGSLLKTHTKHVPVLGSAYQSPACIKAAPRPLLPVIAACGSWSLQTHGGSAPSC